VAAMAAAAAVAVAPADAQITSNHGCACQSACNPRYEVFGQAVDHPACRIDRSQCGTCPYSRCEGGYRLCVFGSCTSCYGGTLACWDRCVDNGDAGLRARARAAARTVASRSIAAWNNFSTTAQDIIADEIAALPPPVRAMLEDAALWANATVADLREIGQDVLAHAQHVNRLVRTQVRGIVDRLVDFTEQNLQTFISALNISVWRESIEDFGCISTWSPAQLEILANHARSALGSIVGWSASDVRRMGYLIRGVTAGNLSQLPALAYESVLLTASITTGGVLSRSRADALAQRAIAVYDRVSQWNESQWRLVGEVASGLASGDLDTVALTVLPEIARVRGWNNTQRRALVERAIILAGDDLRLDNLTDEEWQELAQLARGLAVNRLQQLTTRGIYALGRGVCNSTGVCLSAAQSAEVAASARRLIGTVGSWDEEDWRALGQNIRGLTLDDVVDATEAALPAVADLLDVDPDALSATLRERFATRAVDLLGPLSQWDETRLRTYASLLAAMPPDQLAQITVAGAAQLNAAVGRNAVLSPAQQAAVSTRLQQLAASGMVAYANASAAARVSQFLTPDMVDGMDTSTLIGLAGSATREYLNCSLREATCVSRSVDGLVFYAGIENGTLHRLLDTLEAHIGTPDTWDADTWRRLGPAGAIALARNLTLIVTTNTSRNRILDTVVGMSPAQLRELRDRLVTVYGRVEAVPWEQLGSLATSLTTGDLRSVNLSVIDHLANVQPGVCVDEVACNPDNAGWNISIGERQFCPGQLRAIGRRAVHFLGAIRDWNSTSFARTGHLLRGLDESDIAELTELAFDYIGNVTCWNTDQLRCLARRATQVVNAGRGISSWASSTWAQLGEVVRGLDAETLQQLESATLEAAIDSLGRQRWDAAQLQVLAERAVAAFGPASRWTANTVQRIGSVLAGLADSEIITINPDALSGGLGPGLPDFDADRSAATIQMMCEQRNVHVLSAAQIESMYRAGVRLDTACPSETQRFTTQQALAVQAAEGPASGESSNNSSELSGGETAAIVIVIILLIVAMGVAYVRRQQIQDSFKTRFGKSSNTRALEAGTASRPPPPVRPPPAAATPNPVFTSSAPATEVVNDSQSRIPPRPSRPSRPAPAPVTPPVPAPRYGI